MRPRPLVLVTGFLIITTLISASAGCSGKKNLVRNEQTAIEAGLNTNDLIDPIAQYESDVLGDSKLLIETAEKLKTVLAEKLPPIEGPRRSILCLSGGGAYGAYSAGVLVGWTSRGDRPGCGNIPNFDVVTGISTGALIAPLAFLGPKYDPEIQQFYTTVTRRDIFRLRPVRGLFSIALTDTTPLAKKIEEIVTVEKIREIAEEHRKGRRLYVGTTELEGRRFVTWDIGEIACRGEPADCELIRKILLGSSAIPGFFPPADIAITVDGQTYHEEHGDGGATASIFFRPPYTAPDAQGKVPPASNLSNVDLYLLVAGKLYSDSTPLRWRSLSVVSGSVITALYAQARGDLQRLYLVSLLTGMDYHLAAIPPEFPAATSSTDFTIEAMNKMFNEGYRQATQGELWRKTPPVAGPGESNLARSGTDLLLMPRGLSSGIVWDRKGNVVRFPSPDPVVATPAPVIIPTPAIPTGR